MSSRANTTVSYLLTINYKICCTYFLSFFPSILAAIFQTLDILSLSFRSSQKFCHDSFASSLIVLCATALSLLYSTRSSIMLDFFHLWKAWFFCCMAVFITSFQYVCVFGGLGFVVGMAAFAQLYIW